MSTRLALIIILTVAAVLAVLHVASAQELSGDDGVWLPRAEAADAFGRLSEQDLLKRELETQAKVIEQQERIIEVQARLVELSQREAQAYQRLAEIAGKERDSYKGAADRERRSGRWLRCQAYGATAALIGSVVAPPIGTAAGAVVGCAAGLLVP